MKINALHRGLMLVLVVVVVSGCCSPRDWTEEVHARDGVALPGYYAIAEDLHLDTKERPKNISDWLKLYNYVAYYRCIDERSERKYVRVAEIRDPRLTHKLDRQQYIAYPSPSHSSYSYFKRAPLSLQLQIDPSNRRFHPSNGRLIDAGEDRWVDVLAIFESIRNMDVYPQLHLEDIDPNRQDGVSESGNRKTDPSLKWPAWIPRERIVAEHFIGTLNSGFLFAGSEPGQYFWLSPAT